MARLLIIKSIVNTSNEGAIGTLAVKRFLDVFKYNDLENTVETINLQDTDLNEGVLTNKNMNEFYFNSINYIDMLKSADKILLVTSQYNFSFPNILRNFMDKILVKGLSYQTEKEDDVEINVSLLARKRMQIIYINSGSFVLNTYADPVNEITKVFEFLNMDVQESIVFSNTSKINKKPQEIVDQLNISIVGSAQRL